MYFYFMTNNSEYYVAMDNVTGMTREEMKSIRDQMETVICLSLEGLESGLPQS